ncbi:hypothetical protein BsWGS_03116 [Bradybaena similaris]
MPSGLLLLLAASVAWASGPVVRSPAGTFLGSTLPARNGQIYNAFRGIPYAKPPVGDLRFRPPVAVSQIDGLYDARDFKPYCIQVNLLANDFPPGQEDCLYLNVFTPACADRGQGDLKKVFVFIHGGANTNGSPHIFLPGTLVTEHDIIVVTVAYRLGFLGLLSTMTPSCEGNLHLKDQLLALAWVQENILDFGGDPAGVTVGGESAGAMSTSLLTLVPQSRGLFARAYCQSGATGTLNTILITDPRPEAIKLGRRLGCLQNDQVNPANEEELEQMVSCLKKKPAINFYLNGTSSEVPFAHPVLNGDLFPKNIKELFSDEDYLNSINFLNRDYLMGLDENEGDIVNLLNDQILSTLPEELRKTVTPQILLHNTIQTFLAPVFGPVSAQVIQKVAEYYQNNFQQNPIADFGGDALFHMPVLQYSAGAAAGRSSENSRVYLFRFVHLPEWLLAPYRGMLHVFDLLYLFDLDMETLSKIVPVKIDRRKWSEQDDKMRVQFMTMIGDFIKTGNPGHSLKTRLPSGWPAYDANRQQYLEIDLTPEVKHHLFPERVKLWSEQIPEWIRKFPYDNNKHDEM